jgi:hypothetical protein
MKARAVAGRRSRGRPPRDVHAPAITGPAAAAAEVIAALADRRQVGNAERVAGRYAAAEVVLLAAIEAASNARLGDALLDADYFEVKHLETRDRAIVEPRPQPPLTAARARSGPSGAA